MPHYDLAEQCTIFDRIRAGDKAARDAFICSHQPLVISLMRNNPTLSGVDYDDLFQAGCIGLITAVDSFDPSLGIQFSTYAAHYIRKEFLGLLRKTAPCNCRNVSEKTFYLYMRILRYTDSLLAKGVGYHESDPKLAEAVAAHFRVPVHAVQSAWTYTSRVNFDAGMQEAEVRTLQTPSAEDVYMEQHIQPTIMDDIPGMTDLEKTALACRYRLPPYAADNSDSMSYSEIAKTLRVSISAAQRYVSSGLEKMRRALEKKKAVG